MLSRGPAFASLVLVAACARSPASTLPPTSAATADLADRELPALVLYERALADARFPTPNEVATDLLSIAHNTPGLAWDAAGRVLVYTWSRSQYYTDPKYKPGFSFPLYGETWFTTGTQVHDVCSHGGLHGDDLKRRIQQLLGLPPSSNYDAFLAVWIDPQRLFRPCADASVTATTCPVAAPMQTDAPDHVSWACADVTEPRAQWLCNSWVDRYSNSDPNQRYPWTALGYTYDWHPDQKTHHGASEFVAPAGAEVVFHAVTSTAAFCAK